MYTQTEKRAAAKLYSLIYNGANIYNAPSKNKGKALGDPMIRFVNVVRELKQYMKED